MELDTPEILGDDTNDLITVTGNLTVDGTLNVISLANFTPGDYPIIDYDGTFTDNEIMFAPTATTAKTTSA